MPSTAIARLQTLSLLAVLVFPRWCGAKLVLSDGHRNARVAQVHLSRGEQLPPSGETPSSYSVYAGEVVDSASGTPADGMAIPLDPMPVATASVALPVPPPRPAIDALSSASDSSASAPVFVMQPPLAVSGAGAAAAPSMPAATLTTPEPSPETVEAAFSTIPATLSAVQPQQAAPTAAQEVLVGEDVTHLSDATESETESIEISKDEARATVPQVAASTEAVSIAAEPAAEHASSDTSSTVVSIVPVEAIEAHQPDEAPFPEEAAVPDPAQETNPGIFAPAPLMSSEADVAASSYAAVPSAADPTADPVADLQAVGTLASPEDLRSEADIASRATPSAPQTKPVKIEVFYETMCPACKYLLTQQLGTMYAEDSTIPQWVELNMYPFGNGVVETAQAPYSFKCQHGEEECWGNKLHSCMAKHIRDAELFIPLTVCIAYNDQIPMANAFQACAQRYKMNVDAVANCTLSTQANLDMFELSQKTVSLDPPLEHTPWILINGVHTPEAEGGYLVDVTCSLLSQAALAEGGPGINSIPKACLGRALLSSTSLYRTPRTFLDMVPPPCKKTDVVRA